MRRRDFFGLVGGAAATWLFGAHAQSTTIPVVGFLRNTTSNSSKDLVAAFQHGLKNSGYTEGDNVVVEYRWGRQ